MRKVIDWATDKSKWQGLWPNISRAPLFLYLYPTKPVATTEFHEKWVPEFLPRGKMKDDPVYGWEEEIKNKEIWAVHFNSGSSVYFKTYAQDVQDLQTSTAHAIFCFVAGTLIKTKSGLKPIENIKIGDTVLSKDGYKKVTKIYESESSVITRTFSNGETITATPNHPFFTKNRGWIEFGELTSDDICVSLRSWKLQKKLYYLRAGFIAVGQTIKTHVKDIILEQAKEISSILIYGLRIMEEKFQRVMSSIIKMKTHSITSLATCSSYPVLSTQEYTKSMNGRQKRLGHLDVNFAKDSQQKKARTHHKNIVPQSVLEKIIWKLETVSCALKNLKQEVTRQYVFVLENVHLGGRAKVHNLEVEDSHTYFANGFLVHNCDEELPFPLFNELRSRLIATNGYFHQVFTATLGQDEWRRTMEPANESEELFIGSFKLQVSMYDCLTYTDGTKSFWTPERIKEIESQCTSEAEIQKRVYGRFVVSSGLKIPGFERTRNLISKQTIDSSWAIYTGTDIGGGGERGHPAAIAMVAVRPDGKLGIVFRGWRGDGVSTSSSDILDKHIELCHDEVVSSTGELKKVQLFPVIKSYDYSAKDFFIVSSRVGAGFTPADKRRDAGYGMLNTLFKLGMLKVMDGDPELQKLVVELTSLQEGAAKQSAKDDMVDALRYCIMPIPWNFEGVSVEMAKVEEKNTDLRSEAQKAFDERRPGRLPQNEDTCSVENELEEWQSYIDS